MKTLPARIAGGHRPHFGAILSFQRTEYIRPCNNARSCSLFLQTYRLGAFASTSPEFPTAVLSPDRYHLLRLSTMRDYCPPRTVNQCKPPFTLCKCFGIVLLRIGCCLCEYTIVKLFRLLAQRLHRRKTQFQPMRAAEQKRTSETDVSSVGSGSLTLRDQNDTSLFKSRDISQEYFEQCRTIM